MAKIIDMFRGKPADPAAGGQDGWDNPFETLRRKWSQVPTDSHRVNTPDLLAMPDGELRDWWLAKQKENTTGPEGFRRRGWLRTLYEPLLTGARFMDFGSGLGFDGLTFAPFCGSVTFVDIAESNLKLLTRLAGILGFKNVNCVRLESYESFRELGEGYDVIWANGSMHHAPGHVIRKEMSLLTPRLKTGGRWIQLAYPRVRWVNEGSPSFADWGAMTDGAGTPWAEWYDEAKLLEALAPARFEVVLSFNFWNDSFNWFDLIKRS